MFLCSNCAHIDYSCIAGVSIVVDSVESSVQSDKIAIAVALSAMCSVPG